MRSRPGALAGYSGPTKAPLSTTPSPRLRPLLSLQAQIIFLLLFFAKVVMLEVLKRYRRNRNMGAKREWISISKSDFEDWLRRQPADSCVGLSYGMGDDVLGVWL